MSSVINISTGDLPVKPGTFRDFHGRFVEVMLPREGRGGRKEGR